MSTSKSSQPWPYKTTLVTGASSGIGAALAARIVASRPDAHVVAVARREDRLQELQAANGGASRVSIAVLDQADLGAIGKFVADLTKSHPTLDCAVLNAGMQRGFDFTHPQSIDLALFAQEQTTNFTSVIHLITALLPHFQHVPGPKALVTVTSNLAVIPMTRCPGYCSSKAALHHFLLDLRLQLGLAGQCWLPPQEGEEANSDEKSLRIIELMPPAVQTELHDAKHQPDMGNVPAFGMPLDEFTEEAFARLAAGKEVQVSVQSPPGMAEYEKWRMETATKFARRLAGKK